jgi:signal transduction histidine kinase
MSVLFDVWPNSERRRGEPRLLVFSFLLFFCIVAIGITNVFFIIDPKTPLIVNVSNNLVWLVIVASYFYCTKESRLRRTSNFIVSVSIIVLFLSILETGGICSSDNVWCFFLICTAFLFSGVTSGVFFTIVSVLFFSFLYLAEKVLNLKYIASSSVLDVDYVFLTNTCAVVLMALLLFGFVKTLERVQMKNEMLVSHKLNELNMMLERRDREVETIRSKLARDFHDHTGSKLASIMLVSEILKNKVDNLPVDVVEQIDSIAKNSNELYSHTRDFIWSINSKNSSLDEVVLHIVDFANNFLAPFQIDFNADCDLVYLEKFKLQAETIMQIVLICKEAITNAAKYARCTEVKMICEASNLESLQFKLQILDNGIGFDMHKLRNNRGIGNMHQRAIEIGTELTITTEIGRGTSVNLNFNVIN